MNVLYDPRFKFDSGKYEKQKELFDRNKASVEIADKGFEQLKQAKKTIELVRSSFVNVPDSVKKDVMAHADSLSKKINDIIDHDADARIRRRRLHGPE